MKKIALFLLLLIGLVFTVNQLLDPVMLRYVNKALNEVEGYKGSIGEIEINLWNGSYQIEQLRFDHYDGRTSSPLAYIKKADISVEWAALFEGSIVGELVLYQPELTLTATQSEDTPIRAGQENNWAHTIKSLVPLKLNRFEIVDGQINYKDVYSEPQVDIVLENVQGIAQNISNAEDATQPLPTKVRLQAKTVDNSQLQLSGRVNLIKKLPDFDLQAEISEMKLRSLNQLASAYGNFTFKAGTLYLASEAKMQDGRYQGYVKPILEGVAIVDLTDDSTDLLQKVWELIIGGAIEGLENQRVDRFATKIPFTGNLNSASVATWTSIKNVLKNAFIEAYRMQVE